MVDKQAAQAVQRLLKAQASGRKGASLKSLVLAPHIQAKKATFKVAYNTLRYLTAIKQILASTNLLESNRSLCFSYCTVCQSSALESSCLD